MANNIIAAFFFVLLTGSVFGKCADRTISISYKASNAETIQVFKMCGANTCGDPVLTLDRAGCTKIGCLNDERCNTCWVTLTATNLTVFYTKVISATNNINSAISALDTGSEQIYKDGVELEGESDSKQLGRYGVKFSGESGPFLTITSDWELRHSFWFVKNGFITGCKPRVGCRARAAVQTHVKMPFDVAVTAAGCETSLYTADNAPSLSGCLEGNIARGVPTGEIYGVDCKADPF